VTTKIAMKTTCAHALALLLMAAAGCGPDRPAGGGDGGLGDGGLIAFTPTLGVAINNVIYGPSAPTAGSGASFINTRDPETGRVTSSVFRMEASSAESGTSCSVGAQRLGSDVTPIGQGSYTFAAQLVLSVSPIEGESVTVPQGSWRCTGSDCNGTVFAITRLEAHRVEGYIRGVWPDSSGSAIASVVCSFDVPLTTYVP
jgi:hypothetical protein